MSDFLIEFFEVEAQVLIRSPDVQRLVEVCFLIAVTAGVSAWLGWLRSLAQVGMATVLRSVSFCLVLRFWR